MPSPFRRRLRFEPLEDRRPLAGVVVGNNSDLVNGNTSSINALISNNGGDGISLREAILAANATAGADEITFNAALAGQVILLGGTELAISESLTIDARPLASNVIILANQLLPSRIFNVSAKGDYLWGGLTLLGGRTSSFAGGAAIRSEVNGSSLTVAECIVTGNVASLGRGGAIFVTGHYTDTSQLTLIKSTLTGNTSGGTPVGGGGAVYALHSHMTLIESNVSGNSSTGNESSGGGIFAFTAILRQSTVSGNTTSGTNAGGGGIHAQDVKVYESTVSGNSTQGTGSHGGGIHCSGAHIEQSTVSGNSTTGSGGGIFSFSRVTIARSTITDNRALGATSQGGGVFNADFPSNPFTMVGNSIVAGNVAGGGGPDLVNNLQGPLTVNYSVIGTSVTPTSGDNNVATDAPALGPLADNGGRTKTHAPLAGGPAIDAGDRSIVFNPNEFDQRGAPFVRVAEGRMDAGAHEAQLFTLVVDNPADVEDGVVTPGNLTLREALAFTNTNPGPDVIMFAPALSQAVITLGGTELVITDSVTINALPLAGSVTIDAGLDSRIFHISETAYNVTLAGLHLMNGRTFASGADGHGGGIRSSGFNNLVLFESSVGSNQATGTGAVGGGIYAAGNVTLQRSTVTGNKATLLGGGIYAIGIALNQSTVQFNEASGGGGGVASGSNVTVTQSTIHGNFATSGGGGIHALGDVTLLDSTISDNHSEGGLGPGAGGIFTNGNVSITRSTITNNRSAQSSPTAGAVLQLNPVGSVSFTIDGSIVAGNAAIIGGVEVAHDNDGELAVNYSLIGTGVVPTSGGNNIVTDNPQLGPLTNNGGLTETHAPLVGSPVINAGDPNILVDPEESDQRGEPFVRVAMGRIDIGAVELQNLAPALAGDYNMNGTVDAADYVVWRKTLGSDVVNYTCADGDGNGAVDDGDYTVWRAEFGNALSGSGSTEPPTEHPAGSSGFGAASVPEETGQPTALPGVSTTQSPSIRDDTRFKRPERPATVGVLMSPAHTIASRPAIPQHDARSILRSHSVSRRDASILAWLAGWTSAAGSLNDDELPTDRTESQLRDDAPDSLADSLDAIFTELGAILYAERSLAPSRPAPSPLRGGLGRG